MILYDSILLRDNFIFGRLHKVTDIEKHASLVFKIVFCTVRLSYLIGMGSKGLTMTNALGYFQKVYIILGILGTSKPCWIILGLVVCNKRSSLLHQSVNHMVILFLFFTKISLRLKCPTFLLKIKELQKTFLLFFCWRFKRSRNIFRDFFVDFLSSIVTSGATAFCRMALSGKTLSWIDCHGLYHSLMGVEA